MPLIRGKELMIRFPRKRSIESWVNRGERLVVGVLLGLSVRDIVTVFTGTNYPWTCR
jgi:hypothetical protein